MNTNTKHISSKVIQRLKWFQIRMKIQGKEQITGLGFLRQIIVEVRPSKFDVSFADQHFDDRQSKR